MLLSIVIPFYKIKHFDETLKSLCEQTDQRFNVYIGDDASPDDPQILLKKYKGKFNFSYYRFEENLGGTSLSKQWERCIGLTQEEPWIMILGDDDYLENNLVENWHKFYQLFENNSNVVRFASRILDDKSRGISAKYTHPEIEIAADSYWRKFSYKTRSSLSEYIFKRTVYQKHPFKNYPLGWHSDDMAWIEFSEKKPIYSINISTVFIRISEKSISGNIENQKQKNIATADFRKDLVNTKLKNFDISQRRVFIRRFEDELMKVRRPYLPEWASLFYLHLKYMPSKEIKKLSKRFLKTMINDICYNPGI